MNPNVRRAYQEFDVIASALVRKARKEVSVPCKDGCDACCYDVAWALPPEGEEIAERVRSMPTGRRQAILERIGAWHEAMRAAGLDPDDVYPDLRTYHRARLACPLLDVGTHRCTVYDLRPLSCRGHYVVAPDASVCANRANEPKIQALEMPELFTETLLTMVDGDARAMAQWSESLLPRLLGRLLRPAEAEPTRTVRTDASLR